MYHLFKRLAENSMKNLKQDREFHTRIGRILEEAIIGSVSRKGRWETFSENGDILTNFLCFDAAKHSYIFVS